MREQEAVIWCPACMKDLFTLYREPVGGGNGIHVCDPKEAQEKLAANGGKCECGTVAERKP